MLIHSSDSFIQSNEFAGNVENGLSEKQKYISPKFFYDKNGSELFEQICDQPEYYLTRTETQILKKSIVQIIDTLGGNGISIIELGNGNSQKTRILLAPILAMLSNVSYFPIDVSLKMLQKSIKNLSQQYSNLNIFGICSDYVEGLTKINEFMSSKKRLPYRRLIIFLGSSIGNFHPNEAKDFLCTLSDLMRTSDLMLLGIDTEKDVDILERAYNDKNGITAKFNLNVLSRINRELDADFKLSLFEHKSFYNVDEHRIEMHLESRVDQTVTIGAIGKKFNFKKGETIHTENSYKYSRDRLNSLVKNADLQITKYFTDPRKQYMLILLKKVSGTSKS